MKKWTPAAALILALNGCGGSFPLSPWMASDWKCSARDSNGNLYLGFDEDKKVALERARWQCVSGSPYKQSCIAEPKYCEQLE